MKWFKHSIHARSEHGTEDILRCYGPAGLGIYWCLLEMLGRDTEGFRLKISGVSAEADERFERTRETGPVARHLYRIDLLARTLNTEAELITAVIALGVSEGLFDRELWRTHGVLHSPSFRDQADEYTRRMRRNPPETLRTTPESLPTVSAPDKTGPEEMRSDESGENDVAKQPAPAAPARPGEPPSGGQDDEDELLRRCTLLVAEWNRTHRRAFELRINRQKLRRLRGGNPRWRERAALESMNLTWGGPTFDDVILRAVWLMLEASRTRPIGNQFAWLWSCIHGVRGSPPWVHRPTADEESSPRRQRRSDGGFRSIGEILALSAAADGGSRP